MRLFNSIEKMEMFRLCLVKAINMYRIKVFAWVLLQNHYHLLFKVSNGHDIKKFVRKFHSDTAIYINKKDNTPGRRVWYQYWDYCPRGEKAFYSNFNYIHHNPVKHQYVKNQDSVEGYNFCSYRQWLDLMGRDWLLSCFSEYPIIDYTVDGDKSSLQI